MLKNSICQELSIKVACFTSLLDKYVVLENCQNKVLQFPEKCITFFLTCSETPRSSNRLKPVVSAQGVSDI